MRYNGPTRWARASHLAPQPRRRADRRPRRLPRARDRLDLAAGAAARHDDGGALRRSAAERVDPRLGRRSAAPRAERPVDGAAVLPLPGHAGLLRAPARHRGAAGADLLADRQRRPPLQRRADRLVRAGRHRHVPAGARPHRTPRRRGAGRAGVHVVPEPGAARHAPAGADERLDADRAVGAAPLLRDGLAAGAGRLRRRVRGAGPVERLLPVLPRGAGGDRRDRRAGASSRSPGHACAPPGRGGDRDRPRHRAGRRHLPAREARAGAVADARRRRPVRGAAGGLRHRQPPAAPVVEGPADRRGREGAVPRPGRDRPRAGRAGAGDASRRRRARARAGRRRRAAVRGDRGRGVRAVDGAGAGARGRPPLLDRAVRLAGGRGARPRRPACAGPLRRRRLRRAGGARRLRRGRGCSIA